jgi:transaldolase
VFDKLETEGVDKFEASWNELLEAIAGQLTAAAHQG